MIGPVFGAEVKRAGRRGRAHILRWIYAGWLVTELIVLYFNYLPAPAATGLVPAPTAGETAAFARGFVELVLFQQFALIFLATPAFAAGAVTDEKTRGTLQQLLTADLRAYDIIVGKLLARGGQVAALCLAGLPMLALLGPYAGLTAAFLVTWVAVTILVVFGLSGLSLLASVWTKQTRSAAVLIYGIIAAAAVAALSSPTAMWGKLPAWINGFNPIYALTTAYSTDVWREVGRDIAYTAIAWGGLGVTCTGLAMWRLRPAYIRQLTSPRKRRVVKRLLLPRPAPTGHPLAWKETYVGRRLPIWLAVGLTAAITGCGAAAAVWEMQSIRTFNAWDTVGVLAFPATVLLVLLTLSVGVRASGTVIGERERQTWDGLLATPISPRDLVLGKYRGIIAAGRPHLLGAYLALAASAAIILTPEPQAALVVLPAAALLALVTAWRVPWLRPWPWILLAVVTAGFAGLPAFMFTALGLWASWAAIEFLGAVGIWWSVRAGSSWRSLLGTVVIGYLGGLMLLCVSTPLACTTAATGALVTIVISPGDFDDWPAVVPLFWAAGVAAAYWWAGRMLLAQASAYLANHDRIPSDRRRRPVFDEPPRRPEELIRQPVSI
ncbi:MAG TPA: ABC transporter permease [Gemmataceae bacterium]|jgi:ABC-type transport system involved in multi-copper enzyme maturation permease subunit|nr:ABC transporter permease [Gemmataceae bacterium]